LTEIFQNFGLEEKIYSVSLRSRAICSPQHHDGAGGAPGAEAIF